MGRLRKLILEDEAVIGIKSPQDYLYVKILRVILATIASWPYKEVGEYESNWTLFFGHLHLWTFILAFLGGVAYIYLNFKTLVFLEMGHIIITFMLSAVDISRTSTLTLTKRYRTVVRDFFMEFHLFHHKDRSAYAMKTHKQIHFLSHVFALYMSVQSLTGCCLFNLIPMYNNLSSGKYASGGLGNSTYEHSIYLWYPFDTMTNLNAYIFVNIVNWYISYLTTALVCIFDLFLSIIVFHLWGHFKILINNLNDFPRPKLKSNMTLDDGSVVTAEMFSEDELVDVSKNLKECIDYHRNIIILTDKISEVFGPMLFVYTMFHQIVGCILLLECAQMTAPALLRYLPLTVILFQALIQLSCIFELVGSESDKLKHAVYGLPWESMDLKNRKLVLFFLRNVQEPVHLKAMGVINVGVTSMAQILKTSLSYFTFLRSV